MIGVMRYDIIVHYSEHGETCETVVACLCCVVSLWESSWCFFLLFMSNKRFYRVQQWDARVLYCIELLFYCSQHDVDMLSRSLLQWSGIGAYSPRFLLHMECIIYVSDPDRTTNSIKLTVKWWCVVFVAEVDEIVLRPKCQKLFLFSFSAGLSSLNSNFCVQDMDCPGHRCM